MPDRSSHPSRRHKRAALLLACALSLPFSTPSQAMMDDMFGVMFRMMLIMMNVMSDVMLGNTNSGWGNNWGGLNSFNLGMGTLPMASGFGAPWSRYGSPWSGGGYPFAAANPGYFPGNAYPPYGGYGSPGRYAAPGYPNTPAFYPSASLLEGRWYGNSGEILEIRGNRFELQAAGAKLAGTVNIENNIVSMYSPQTNTLTRYSFLRNQTELLLTSGNGSVLVFHARPPGRSTGIFQSPGTVLP